MLTKPFINRFNVIELPGPLFNEQKNQEYSVNFTQNLVDGIGKILPKIERYELRTWKMKNVMHLRIRYESIPDDMTQLVEQCPGWTLDEHNSVIYFIMDEHI